MKFEEKLAKILDILYNAKNVGEINKELKKIEKSEEMCSYILNYAKEKELIKKARIINNRYALQLTPKGIDFLSSYKKEKSRDDFTKIVAFTGSVLALIGIYGFLNALVLGSAKPEVYWTISIIFLILIIICLGPLIAFVINYYKEWILEK